MRVLVACERSGVVRDAFRLLGHDAWSCDIATGEKGGPHIHGDALDHLTDGWDMLIAHPPCTWLARVNIHNRRLHVKDERDARAFTWALWSAPIQLVAVENPIGALWDELGKPTQVIEPWQFGHPYTKRTCLWLRGLPLLVPTTAGVHGDNSRPGRKPAHVDTWTEAHRSAQLRSKTFEGIALAMASQWGQA